MMGSNPSGPTKRQDYNGYMRVFMLRRYHKRRAAIIADLGGRCIECGATEHLEIDHIEPSKKRVRLNQRLSGLSAEKLKEEVAKCQLLCTACHKEKTRVEHRVRMKKR